MADKTSYFDTLHQYGKHMATCPDCDPPKGKICEKGASLAAEVAISYKQNPPPDRKS